MVPIGGDGPKQRWFCRSHYHARTLPRGSTIKPQPQAERLSAPSAHRYLLLVKREEGVEVKWVTIVMIMYRYVVMFVIALDDFDDRVRDMHDLQAFANGYSSPSSLMLHFHA